MKRILSFLLSLIMILTLSVSVMADGEEFSFSLFANGKVSETVRLGETVNVTLVISKNDGAESIDLYSAQDYICFDPEYLEFVDATGYSHEGVQIFSANPVKLMDTVDKVYTNRSSLTPLSVNLPLTVVSITFRTLKAGTTEVSHDTPEMLDNSVSHSIKKNNAAINIVTDSVEDNTPINNGGGGGGGSSPKCSLTFMTPDGVVLDEVKKAENSTVTLSMYKFDKVGYIFEGWYTDKALTDKVTSIKMEKNITLYANWKVDVEARLNNRPKILTTEHYAYIVGREGGYICPQDNITRAEVATIFYRLLTEETRTEYKTAENAFTDVNANDWFNTEVSTLAAMGIVNGRDSEHFAPNEFITRAEFTAMAARLSNVEYDGGSLFTDIAGHWAEDYINTAASIGWVVGENNKFRPDDFITRAEAMTLVNRVLCREPKTKNDLHQDMTVWADNADETAWYYLAVQEATNSHTYTMKEDDIYEKWVQLTQNPDWN